MARGSGRTPEPTPALTLRTLGTAIDAALPGTHRWYSTPQGNWSVGATGGSKPREGCARVDELCEARGYP